jgi:hypothetical protein
MASRSRCVALLLMMLLPLVPARLPSQIPARWSACRTDSLSNFNCASYYSGSVSLTSELKGAGVSQSLSVVATVSAGKVACRVKGSETGDFEGPGMLAVELEGAVDGGEYKLSVWCPEGAGKRPTRNDAATMETYDQRADNYTRLSGKDAHEHPEADAANGLSGTETIVWDLKRP